MTAFGITFDSTEPPREPVWQLPAVVDGAVVIVSAGGGGANPRTVSSPDRYAEGRHDVLLALRRVARGEPTGGPDEASVREAMRAGQAARTEPDAGPYGAPCVCDGHRDCRDCEEAHAQWCADLEAAARAEFDTAQREQWEAERAADRTYRWDQDRADARRRDVQLQRRHAQTMARMRAGIGRFGPDYRSALTLAQRVRLSR